MNVKVIKKFKDKVTGEVRHVGDKISVSKKRFEEIEAVGHFVEEINAKKKTNIEEEEKTSE